jgi:peptide/nickel transport system substrate-binding protein
MTDLSRRRFLTSITGLAGMALLAACGSAPAPTPAPSPPATTSAALQTTLASATAPGAAPASSPAMNASPQAAAAATFIRAPESNPKTGGVLRTAFGATTAHYDIHQGGDVGTLGQMYDLLVMPNPQDGFATIIPNLAETWDVSPDNLTYTFKVRDGVTFHDGTPFSAEDVVATFQRITAPPKDIASILQDYLTVVDKIEQVDRLTMRFVLKHPWSPFLGVLSAPQMVIYSKKTLEANNYDLRKVIAPGTGEFVYKEYKQGEHWVFTRNPNYYNPGLPYVDGLEMLDVPAWTDRGTAVLTGQADLSWNVSVDTFQEGQKRPETVVTREIPHFGAPYAFTLNNQKKPFDDPRVRRAIHLAVSRQNLINAFKTQETLAVDRWMFQSNQFAMPEAEILKLPGYRPEKIDDIAEAKRLLQEAGYPNGFNGVELMTATVPAHVGIMAPAFQDELQRTLNIGTTIKALERATLNDVLLKGAYDIQFSTLSGTPSTDPTPMWNALWKTGASQNWTRYSNPAFDKILDQINLETDDKVRQDLFNQGMDLLDQNPPAYYIGYCCYQAMWRTNVKGIMANWRHTQWGRIQTAWLNQ